LVTARASTAQPAHVTATNGSPWLFRCRLCDEPLRRTFVDLGPQPLAEAYVSHEALDEPEVFYPLRVFVCESCFLVQLPVFASPDAIFREYPYFSSYSESWLDHARRYVDQMIERFGYGSDTNVVEVASNDGYLLQFFKRRGIGVLGVDPARNVAAVAEQRGIPTVPEFFGRELAQQLRTDGRRADLIVGNNVLAHVPDVHDFVEGVRILVKPDGLVTMEFPHLLRLVEGNQLDTIYHEHFSYLSLHAVERLFAEHGLALFDVEEIPTHGGSLRIFACPADAVRERLTDRVDALRARELETGVTTLAFYETFEERAQAVKRGLLTFLVQAKERGETVVGYGAAAKGSTLLNYCGVRSDLVDYVVDRSPHKQGRYLPGVRIPIFSPDRVRETRPNYLLVLPWNIKDEIVQQMADVREFGCNFVVPIPELAVL
jgi:SAM-dependent methyltransferase